MSASPPLAPNDATAPLISDPDGRARVVRASLLVAVPAALILITGLSVLLGGEGLVKRYRLGTDLTLAQGELAAIQRENQHMQRELRLMDDDPRTIERRAAESLSWGAPGTTLYRFHPPAP